MSTQLQQDIRTAVEQTVARHLTIRLQHVYSSLQNELNATGDIAPWEIDSFEANEAAFAAFVARWMVGNMPFDLAEAMGMDGTLRDT